MHGHIYIYIYNPTTFSHRKKLSSEKIFVNLMEYGQFYNFPDVLKPSSMLFGYKSI